ncbi:MAG: hypothetical protein RLZZ410_1286 [Pseudomonadota bacterium]|jgi:uncharacterized protein (TIGR00255 family)
MIESMTGFGSASRQLDLGGGVYATVAVECRSVNSRFLDLNIRSPEECRSSEMAIRELVTKHLSRGKVEFRINVQREAQSSQAPTDLLNQEALTGLKALEAAVLKEMPSAGNMRMGEILRWPGILNESKVNDDLWRIATVEAAGEAVKALKVSRQGEGKALLAILMERVNGIRAIVSKVEPLIPTIVAAHQAKLSERLTEILTGVDAQGHATTKTDISDRIRQEVVLYGVRIDVAEELSRLKTHLDVVESALTNGGPVGKRLDFLMQELNREANTLGSKSVSQESSDASIEMKLLIEQMREQVQNLE